MKPETQGKLMVAMVVSILAFGIGTGTVLVTGLYLNMSNPFNMTLNQTNLTNQTNQTIPSVQTNNNINTAPSTSSSNNGQSQKTNNTPPTNTSNGSTAK